MGGGVRVGNRKNQKNCLERGVVTKGNWGGGRGVVTIGN